LADPRPWVLQQAEPCEECGYVPLDHDPADLPDAIRGLGRRYRMPLTRFLAGEDPGTIVRTRPAPDRWSALEYACHTRDVLSVFNARVLLMVAEDRPSLGWWDHEAAADDDAYNAQDPVEVADALDRNAMTFAETLEAVPATGWSREGVRRSGELFTILGAGRFVLHEGHHHLLDVGRSLRAARGR
jgi:hypothetical protein